MYGTRHNRFNVHLRGCAFLILAGASLASHAAPARFEKIYQNGNPIFVPVGNPAGVYTDAQSIWNRTFGLSPSGPVTTGAVGSFRNPSGKSVPIDVTAKLKPSAISGAVGRALAKSFAPLAAGVAIYDLSKELGYGLSRDPDGTVRIVREGQTTTTAPAFSGEYRHGYHPIFPSRLAACEDQRSYINNLNGGVFTNTNARILPDLSCVNDEKEMPNGPTTVRNMGRATQITPPSAEGTTTSPESPATYQELVDLVASKSGWPTSSSLGRVLTEDIDKNPSFQREIEPTTVTGPSTSPGSVSTTSDSAAGTTSRSTTTHNHTYDGNTVNTTNVTTTVTTNNSTGAVSNTTTTTAADNEPPPPKDPCADNPDRIGCSKLDTPEEVMPRETKNVAFAVDAITWGAAASCPPPWLINVPTISKSFSVKYDPFCDIASRVRPFILAGAAFVAMMIVMAGIKT